MRRWRRRSSDGDGGGGGSGGGILHKLARNFGRMLDYLGRILYNRGGDFGNCGGLLDYVGRNFGCILGNSGRINDRILDDFGGGARKIRQRVPEPDRFPVLRRMDRPDRVPDRSFAGRGDELESLTLGTICGFDPGEGDRPVLCEMRPAFLRLLLETAQRRDEEFLELVSMALTKQGIDLGHGWEDEFKRSARLDEEGFVAALGRCTTWQELQQLVAPAAMNSSGEQPSATLVAVDRVAAEKAWRIPYVRSDAVAGSFVSKLRAYAALWKPEKWYVPLCAVIQSSGWGKSRLISELWRDGIFVIYMSCMRKAQTGFPRRTERLADIIESVYSSETEIVTLLLSTLSVLKRSGCSPQQWMEGQQDGDVYARIYAEYLQLLDGVAAKAPQRPDSNADSALSSFYTQCTKAYGVKLRKALCEVPAGMLVLWCLDEAGELKTPAFANFRRSLKYVPATGNFFSVVLGTDRKVADLASAYDEDVSSRVRDLNDTNKLFDPICLIGESDILVTDSSADGGAVQVVRYGRPLWAAYYDSVESTDKVSATISLARKKLLGGHVVYQQGWVTREIAVSVFAALIGLDVVAWATLPQELAARHTRTIIRISADRKRVYTASAAEPALAAAAAELLHSKGDGYLGDFLCRLRGEMVVRIILILAMHQLTKDANYIKAVSLRDFVSVLFGNDVVEMLEENCSNLDVELFFNCFLPSERRPTDMRLRDYSDRCAAMVNRRNETRVDFCIPGKVSASTTRISYPRAAKKAKAASAKKAKAASDFYPIQMGFPCQVKNRTSDGCVAGEDRFNQTAGVVFQIGSRNSKVEVVGTMVVVHGLEFARTFLGEQVVAWLKQLASTHVNIFKDAEDERVLVEHMLPLAYKDAADDNDDAEDEYEC